MWCAAVSIVAGTATVAMDYLAVWFYIHSHPRARRGRDFQRTRGESTDTSSDRGAGKLNVNVYVSRMKPILFGHSPPTRDRARGWGVASLLPERPSAARIPNGQATPRAKDP